MSSTDTHLEPFLIMARNMKGSAAAKVIKDATSAPDVFGFGELLQVENIQQLQTGDHEKSYKLLELFAYGDLQTYKIQPAKYPELSDAQMNKLKQLTLIKLCLQSRSLAYTQLLAELEILNVRDLEDLIIDAMYSSVLGGKLDQKQGVLSVDWVIGRDVNDKDDSMAQLKLQLEGWCGNAQAILNTIDREISQAKADAAYARRTQQDWVERRDAAYTARYHDLTEFKEKEKSGGRVPQASSQQRPKAQEDKQAATRSRKASQEVNSSKKQKN